MFGAIPGAMKPEYHFRYPRYEAFADMIVDRDEYFRSTVARNSKAVFASAVTAAAKYAPRRRSG